MTLQPSKELEGLNFMLRHIIFLLVLLIFSCEKPATVPSSSIIGQWLWQESSGGIAGQTIYADNENPLQMEFTSGGLYKEYQNGILHKEFPFQIVLEKSIRSAVPIEIIEYENSHFSQSFSIQGDDLILYDEVFDGYTHRYSRLK